MLETLIKRDGTQEEFSITKSNAWSLWSIKGYEDRLDWTTIVNEVRNESPSVMTSQDWQMALINKLIVLGQGEKGWPYMVMAGRLYTVYLLKKLHNGVYPSIKEVQQATVKRGLARQMNYSDAEYEFLDKFVIDHEKNLEMVYHQVQQYHLKYALRDRTTGEVFETPQYVMIRMAMAVYENDDPLHRLEKIKEIYLQLVEDCINPPTPNYAALGTRHFGMASCCLIESEDTADSIAAAGLVAYKITLASAGIGILPSLRAPGDPVDGGRVAHAGMFNYMRKLLADSCANKQGMRGGAMNIKVNVYHPEIKMMIHLQNPRTPIKVRERGINVTYQTNPFFVRKAMANEDYFTFTEFSAPDLFEAFFEADQSRFEQLYAKYEADPNFKKNYLNAKEVLREAGIQELEVSTLFWEDPSALSARSPYKKAIRQTNLCQEVAVRASPWKTVQDLFGDGHPSRGETGICNIGSIAQHSMPFDPNDAHAGYARYKRAVRAQYEMIDFAIENSEYHFPAVAVQAKSRRNAALGMSGVATKFAEMGLRFNTPEGRRAWHVMCERHAFACIEVALELGIEKGNAPWINGPNNDGVDGTRWVDGWLPIDSYKKKLDEVVDSTLVFDWEDLRRRVVANKGLRFSTLIGHMPGEQSTRKGTGTNSIYPLYINSADMGDGSTSIPWAAKDNDLILDKYQMAFDLEGPDYYGKDLMIHYGICNKFCDQSISLDDYWNTDANPAPSEKQVFERFLNRMRYGNPAKYYTRQRTTQAPGQQEITLKGSSPELASAQVAMSALDRIAAQAKAMSLAEDDGLGSSVIVSCGIDGGCTN